MPSSTTTVTVLNDQKYPTALQVDTRSQELSGAHRMLNVRETKSHQICNELFTQIDTSPSTSACRSC